MGGCSLTASTTARSAYSPVTWLLALLLGPADRRCGGIILFRTLWVALFILGLESVFSLGTSQLGLAIAGWCGISLATHGAFSRLSGKGFLIAVAGVWLAYLSLFSGASLLIGTTPGNFFTVDKLDFHIQLALLVATVAAGVTWFFWRVRAAITVEAIALAATCIAVFAGHRGFHFNRPKIVNTLAWELRVDHLTMLLAIGGILLVASSLYIAITSRARRPLAETTERVEVSSGTNIPFAALLIAALMGLVVAVQYSLYQHYSTSMLARVANGVGMESKPGVSPLTFQSALGSTNQPSALVRLEGDYTNNPFTPMLYLRESALSAFNGKEMVNAGRAYDTDVPGIPMTDSFTGQEDPDLLLRTPVIQSIYPLADHNTAFALDYPLSIVQLKNPKPNRFKGAYRTYSSGPGFSLSEIEASPVGDPRWTEETRIHYTAPHQDPRYKETAEKLTSGITEPVKKVLALTGHLNKTAIYTLSPNHTLQPNEDPVSPFLFGDHRGYCVHFAHAVVYMARGLGIPARVGTGYLTDLSQSKDGHILLLMSDRHAWAEVYVQNYGWIPFDVQPEQVESHADNKVDAKLLEELMGMIDPGEEILPDEVAKDEPGMEEPMKFALPDPWVIVYTVIGCSALFFILKSWLILGWRVTSNPAKKAARAYVSGAACFEDVGIRRRIGETREEFASRIPQHALEKITRLVLARSYQSKERLSISAQEVTAAYEPLGTFLKELPWWKRVLGALNPSSVITWLTGGRW